MILLRLFLTFLEIGAVSFGGGYGMIPLIREKILLNGWTSEEKLLDMIAVAETTPGPIAVNLATFIGTEQRGAAGALCATLGVVLPSFLVILLAAALLKGLTKYRGVQAFLSGVRPCVVGLILATAATLFLSGALGFGGAGKGFRADWIALVILAVLGIAATLYRKKRKKAPPPVLMLLLSAGLGMLLYALQSAVPQG